MDFATLASRLGIEESEVQQSISIPSVADQIV